MGSETSSHPKLKVIEMTLFLGIFKRVFKVNHGTGKLRDFNENNNCDY